MTDAPFIPPIKDMIPSHDSFFSDRGISAFTPPEKACEGSPIGVNFSLIQISGAVMAMTGHIIVAGKDLDLWQDVDLLSIDMALDRRLLSRGMLESYARLREWSYEMYMDYDPSWVQNGPDEFDPREMFILDGAVFFTPDLTDDYHDLHDVRNKNLLLLRKPASHHEAAALNPRRATIYNIYVSFLDIDRLNDTLPDPDEDGIRISDARQALKSLTTSD